MEERSRHRIECCTFIFGIFLLVIAVILMPIFNAIMKKEIDSAVILMNGSLAYTDWSTQRHANIYMKIRVFNVTNPEEVTSGGVPKVKEIGPYTYRLKSPKKNVHWSKGNELVSYDQHNYYEFQKNLSNGLETDRFVTLNVPAVLAMNNVKYAEFKRLGLIVLFGTLRVKLFKELSIKDLVWGYSDSLILALHTFMPHQFPEKFGLFYGLNGTKLANFTVYTGFDDISQLNKIYQYNGLSNVTCWQSVMANKLLGTDGGLYTPNLDKDKSLLMFVQEMSRSVAFNYQEDVTYNKLDLWRYMAAKLALANKTDNPANVGYCLDGHCLPSGLLNMSSCLMGAPIVVSWPHFYMADPKLLDTVDGLKPTADKHASFLDAEPNLGAVPHSVRRDQYNFYIEPIQGVSFTSQLRKTYFPVIWFDTETGLNEYMCNYLYDHFMYFLKLVPIIAVLMALLGGAIVLVCGVGMYVEKKKRADPEGPLITDISVISDNMNQ